MIDEKALTAPAAMPSVEDVARIICRRVHEAICPNAEDWRPGELERKVDIYWPHYTREASAILALFATILAEKEREIAASIESHDAWATIWNDKLEAAEARALAAEAARDAALLAARHETDLCEQALADLKAAEAALAAERERCARIAERFMAAGKVVDGQLYAGPNTPRAIAAAIRAQGE